jgi:hypothetical protein
VFFGLYGFRCGSCQQTYRFPDLFNGAAAARVKFIAESATAADQLREDVDNEARRRGDALAARVVERDIEARLDDLATHAETVISKYPASRSVTFRRAPGDEAAATAQLPAPTTPPVAFAAHMGWAIACSIVRRYVTAARRTRTRIGESRYRESSPLTGC